MLSHWPGSDSGRVRTLGFFSIISLNFLLVLFALYRDSCHLPEYVKTESILDVCNILDGSKHNGDKEAIKRALLKDVVGRHVKVVPISDFWWWESVRMLQLDTMTRFIFWARQNTLLSINTILLQRWDAWLLNGVLFTEKVFPWHRKSLLSEYFKPVEGHPLSVYFPDKTEGDNWHCGHRRTTHNVPSGKSSEMPFTAGSL